MTDAEMLDALVKKAVSDGLKWDGYNITSVGVEIKKGHLPIYIDTDEPISWTDDDDIVHNEFNGQAISIETMLFNKEFARALFGGTDTCINCGQEHIHPNGICDVGYGFELPACDYHRQQAVISDNAIKYMYDQLYGKETN